MIIDFHTHIFPERVIRERESYLKKDPSFSSLYSNPKAKMARAEDLVESMERNGVDFAVILGGGWTDMEFTRMMNDYILEASSKYRCLIPFCSVPPHLGDEALKELERCIEGGARGIGELRADDQHFLKNPEILEPIERMAREKGLIILFHSSEPVGHLYQGKGKVYPSFLYRLLELFPESKKVFAHWGGGLFFYSLMPEVEKALKNSFFDTAATPFLYREGIFRVAKEIIGVEKILFGTDFPLISHERMIKLVRGLDMEDEDKEKIFGKNARGLLFEDKNFHSR